MFKRVLPVLLVLCLLLSLPATAYAVNASTSKNTRTTSAALAASSATPISVSNILLTSSEVSAIVTLSTGAGLVTLPVAGAIRSSYKVEFGINSAIVEAATSVCSSRSKIRRL